MRSYEAESRRLREICRGLINSGEVDCVVGWTTGDSLRARVELIT